jgi:hypothetical protein
MTFLKHLFWPERRVQTSLVIFCWLTAIEGIAITLFLSGLPGEPVGPFQGLTIKRLLLMLFMFALSGGLMGAGGYAIRRPQVSQKWLDWTRKPVIFQWTIHGVVMVILCSWLAVAGWKGTLDQVFSHFVPWYDRLYPFLFWLMLASTQAGLLLCLAAKHNDRFSGEAVPVSPIIKQDRSVLSITAIVLPVLVYVLILYLGIPRSIGRIFRYDLYLLSGLALFGLYFAFRHQGWKATLIGLTFTMAMSALALAYLWNTGASEEPVVMGLFPFKDPSNYYNDAQRILLGQTISNFGGRPFFTGFLSFLLWLTGRNLQAALAVLVAVASLSSYIAAQEIRRHFGPAVAALALYLMLIYYRQFTGTTSTENLGFTLGALGLAFLLKGFRIKSLISCLVGLFLVCFALNARPGPFFILPFIILWFTLAFCRSHKFLSLMRPFVLGIAVSLLAFAFNYLFFLTISTPNAAMFSRFPHTFYGLAVGGKDWVQISKDYPEVVKLPDPQRSEMIYALGLKAVWSNPGRFIQGIVKNFQDFFSARYGAYNFIYGDLKIRQGLFFISLLGLVFLAARPKNPLHLLLSACLAGIFLSIPFVPPRASDYMRTYAAVVPFIVLVPALSLALPALFGKMIPMPGADKVENIFLSPEFIFTALLVVGVIAGPYLATILAAKPNFQQTDCAAPDQAFYLRVAPGSYVQLVADDAGKKTHLPVLKLSDLKNSVNDFTYRRSFNQQPFKTGTILLETIDLRSGDYQWFSLPAVYLPLEGSVIRICAQPDKTNLFIFADSFTIVGK